MTTNINWKKFVKEFNKNILEGKSVRKMAEVAEGRMDIDWTKFVNDYNENIINGKSNEHLEKFANVFFSKQKAKNPWRKLTITVPTYKF